MNLQSPQALVETIRSYMTFDTKTLFSICERFLRIRKQKTFDLPTQNGLLTLIELHVDSATLSAFFLFQLKGGERQEQFLDDATQRILQGLDSLKEVTILGSIPEGQSAESVRKMFLSLSKDLRVLLVLMALRYAELFELDQLSPPLRKRLARQTLKVFVPLLGRLGIYTLKRKFEDRCFSYLSYSEYKAVEIAYLERPELKEATVERLVKLLTKFLQGQAIKATVNGRIKGKYSTYQKLKEKGTGFIDEISDLIALRVIVQEQTDCYTVLSLVNNRWQPIIGRFKDYIALPKANGYRSLHTALIGMIEGSLRTVEIQIRTMEMNREAECGIAAHWWYEEEPMKKTSIEQLKAQSTFNEKMELANQLLRFEERKQQGSHSFDFFVDRIFVMTLTGVVIELPKGSTPLDFAYALSESLGNHCAKARVNGKVVPLNYQLQNGDRVFVVKKMEVTPTFYWLSLAKTEKAHQAIRKWLFKQGGRKDLMKAVGKSDIDTEKVVPLITQESSFKKGSEVAVSHEVVVAGMSGFKTKFPACCHPTAPSSLRGYVTRGGFISVHREHCKVLSSLDPARSIDAWWREE